MNSKLLKLNEPYKVIYAAGKVGRHIATLMTWADDPDGEGEVIGAHQYAVIDQGNEYPAGTLVEDAELEDCRVLCTYDPKEGITGTNVYWLSSIIEYDFQQLEPAGAEFILESLQRLGCVVRLPQIPLEDEDGKPLVDKNGRPLKDEDGHPMVTDELDMDGSLWVSLTKGNWDEDLSKREYIVKSPPHQSLYFEAKGTADEIFSELQYQLSVYSHYLLKGIGCVKFSTTDGYLADVFNRLNKKQGIETDYKDIW